MFDHLPRPLLFAHRGASMRAPENTLEAFELATQLGAHVLELDVHHSKDERVVVFHDATIDRTTDATGPIRSLSLAEIKRLDAGYRFRDRTGELSFRERGVQVPTLEEVIAAFPRASFNIELKVKDRGLLSSVLAILEPLATEQVLLAAGRQEIMAGLESSGARFPLGMSRTGVLDVLKRVWTGQRVPERYRGRALQIPPRSGLLPVASGRLVRKAKHAGLEVHLWTLNDPGPARQWLHRGVDGIMSDDPQALIPLFGEGASGSATSLSPRARPRYGSEGERKRDYNERKRANSRLDGPGDDGA